MKFLSKVFEELPRSAIEILIDEWIFSERDRAILKRRLLELENGVSSYYMYP